MSIVAVIRDMVAAGFTMEQALTAAEIMERNGKGNARSNAERQAAWRERQKLKRNENSVTHVTNVTEQTLPSPDGPPPQTPPPLNPPSCPDPARAAEPAAPRQAQPEAGQGRVDYDELHGWLGPLVGTNPVAINLDISPMVALIRAGYSRERIEIGVRAAVAAAKQPIRSWKTFEGWVKNTAADAKPIAKPIDRETEWRNKLRHYHAKGEWPGVWGDPPGHPCCSIPAAFIEANRPHTNTEEAA